MKEMINKEDLIRAGFAPYTAAGIIRQAKAYMVKQGYEFYSGRRVAVVPAQAVKAVLGDVNFSYEGN
ncbi:DUF3173 domain-containing protein [Fructobacillus sp. M1-13]|uniref:DUF3173 family protein n=1 Tax=Fructobacillus papyriferae TaxID=2713171 RepID=A0ABS5QP29_9LACO|nr:DUF3173 family protein [Fructobacillus papyriferae]MBS9334830.1 DUF3173 family protein [Fructobacillus papyriferae]MCD2158820.1 DUF3173 domain-containing protein [Fructobacillus papyriferae]